MSSTAFRTRPRRLLGVLVAIAVCVLALGALTDPARANSVVTPESGPAGRLVHGHLDGAPVDALTAVTRARVNGVGTSLLGATPSRPLQFGVDYTEADWRTPAWLGAHPSPDAAAAVAWLVGHDEWARGDNPDEIAAVQAALWHLTTGFELDEHDARNRPAVVGRYRALLDGAAAHATAGHPASTLSFATTTVIAATTGAPAYLSVTGSAPGPWSVEADADGVELHPAAADGSSCDTSRSLDSMSAPGTFCVTRTTPPRPADPAAVRVSVRSAATWTDGGRVFVRDGRRPLVMADRTPEQSVAVSTVSWP